MEPIKLSQLRPRIRNKEITVRVIRKWKRQSQKNPIEVYGMEFILLDEEEQTIQASCNAALIGQFEKAIIEGNIYTISKFRTSPNYSHEKASTHPCRLYLEYSTIVHEQNDVHIPMYGFKFASFEDILQDNVGRDHYFDVIGEFAQYHPITVSGDFRKMKIELCDTKDELLTCTVWSKYCDEIQTIVNEYVNAKERPVIILQCVMISDFKGERTIQTTRGGTKVYVELDVPEVITFKKRRSAMDVHSGSSRLTEGSTEDGILSKTKLKRLHEITSCTKAGDYVTIATIIEVDSNMGWYYNSCETCKSKVHKKDDGLWYCNNNNNSCQGKTIGMTTSFPRYQVKFFVSGDTDDYADNYAEFMIFDKIIESFVKKSAIEVLAAQKKEGDKDAIPKEFKVLIGRKFVAKVNVSKEFNIEKNKKCYTVINLIDDEEMLTMWRKNYSSVKGKQVAESSSSNYVDNHSNNTVIFWGESSSQ